MIPHHSNPHQEQQQQHQHEHHAYSDMHNHHQQYPGYEYHPSHNQQTPMMTNPHHDSYAYHPGEHQHMQHHYQQQQQQQHRGYQQQCYPPHQGGSYHQQSFQQQHHHQRGSFYPPPPSFRGNYHPNGARYTEQHQQPLGPDDPRRCADRMMMYPSSMTPSQMTYDNFSRTPSPPGIPAPPSSKWNASMGLPSKLKTPMAIRTGPLSESSRRLNTTDKDSINDVTQLPVPRQLPETKIKKRKSSNELSDATLLLGLRTCGSSSPNEGGGSTTTTTVGCLTIDTSESHDSNAPTITTTVTSPQQQENKNSSPQQLSTPKAPTNYPTRLAMPDDNVNLNSLHCYIRKYLLEVFCITESKNNKYSTSVGRVGLRCVHCAQARPQPAHTMDETAAPMAVFYPKCVEEIYRLVTSWQRCHLRKCRNLPPSVRNEWERLRTSDKSRGKTCHWLSSAQDIGLVNSTIKGGGVRFAEPAKTSVDEGIVQSGEMQPVSIMSESVDIENEPVNFDLVLNHGPASAKHEHASAAAMDDVTLATLNDRMEEEDATTPLKASADGALETYKDDDDDELRMMNTTSSFESDAKFENVDLGALERLPSNDDDSPLSSEAEYM